MRALLAAFLGIIAAAAAAASDVAAQPAGAQQAPPEVVVPNFLDPRRRVERPNLSGIAGPLRFLTAPDHPPFNFTGRDGEPTGFHVELIRAVCVELRVTCTLQAMAFDQLVTALRENRGDAVVAGLALTPAIRREFEVGEIYLRSPARFVVRRDGPLPAVDATTLRSRRVGVVAGTAHAAFLETFFPGVERVAVPTAAEARALLKRGEVVAVFGDAVGLAFWINGTDAENCCVFRGGGYLESRFFGEGYAMLFRPGADVFRRAVDHALQRLAEKGTFTELYLRWFPVSLYDR